MKLFFKWIILGLSLLSSLCASALSSSYTISVSKVAITGDPDRIKDPDRSRRIPSVPIECLISPEGIELKNTSVTSSDILFFEIWDSKSEFCMGSFATESDFVSTLLSMSGDYQIRFVTEDYELTGYISL